MTDKEWIEKIENAEEELTWLFLEEKFGICKGQVVDAASYEVSKKLRVERVTLLGDIGFLVSGTNVLKDGTLGKRSAQRVFEFRYDPDANCDMCFDTGCECGGVGVHCPGGCCSCKTAREIREGKNLV